MPPHVQKMPGQTLGREGRFHSVRRGRPTPGEWRVKEKASSGSGSNVIITSRLTGWAEASGPQLGLREQQHRQKGQMANWWQRLEEHRMENRRLPWPSDE
eukprot:g45621.t1